MAREKLEEGQGRYSGGVLSLICFATRVKNTIHPQDMVCRSCDMIDGLVLSGGGKDSKSCMK